ncbi:MAG: amidohydrolase [Betaproteobacteria bacterium]
MRRPILVAVLAGVALLPVRALEHADRIFVDGRIWTADTAHPYAEALAVSGDRLLVVGSTADVRAVAGPDTAVVDLKGRFVVPGFRDSHAHFPGPTDSVDLSDASSVREVQRRLIEFARTHPTEAWIRGRGWGYSAFPDRKPDKRYLDEVVPTRPAYVVERDGHMGLANSKALAVAGITKDTPDPPNGHIERDAAGEPTGELKEAAQQLLTRHIPAPTAEERYQAFLAHMDRAAAAGLTAIQNASWSPDDQPLVLRALSEGRLKLRFRFATPILLTSMYPRGHRMDAPLTSADLAGARELRDTFRGPLVEFGAVKGVLDGVIDARTAAMMQPYVGGGTGLPFWDQDDLDRTVALYDQEGFQVLLHAIGDKAIHMALDAYEYAARVNGTSGRRHRVEHVEVPDLGDIARFRQLGVIASTQAMFALPDDTTLHNYAVVLGPARASHANAFRLFDEAGVVQAFGSDWSVFPFEPLPAMYVAATRMTPAGTPAGGWYPENRIPVEAALRHYTIDGAYASFDEAKEGSLVAGKLADFVVLSQDILASPPRVLLDARVLLTVMGGRDTYRAPAFP